MFSLDDLAISHPHALVERVPSLWMFVFGGGLPLFTILAWALVARPGLHRAHVSVLGLFISLLLTIFLTDVIKNSVGRPRPDLIARCKPEEATPVHILVTIDVCTETAPHVLQDGWRSFPSGHSSFAFAGLGYLAL
jgi:diacylglycerol diphosphate phosphatase / phosphatidate phosphatase